MKPYLYITANTITLIVSQKQKIIFIHKIFDPMPNQRLKNLMYDFFCLCAGENDVDNMVSVNDIENCNFETISELENGNAIEKGINCESYNKILSFYALKNLYDSGDFIVEIIFEALFGIKK
jgi:hypothetical protein